MGEEEGKGNLSRSIEILSEKIEELQKNSNGKKKKGFKIGAKGNLSRNQLKNNYAVVQLIKRNGEMDFLKRPIENGTIHIPQTGTYHKVNAKDVLYHNKIPYLLLPEWSLNTLNPYDKIEDKGLPEAEKIMILASRLSQIKPKKGMPSMKLFMIFIAIVIVLGLIGSALGVY